MLRIEWHFCPGICAFVDAGAVVTKDVPDYVLEELLADYTGVKFAIGVGSGTDAMLMILMGNDVGPGDVVFTTTFTFIATAEVIQLLKATPVFVDIERDTFNMNVNKLKESIQKVTG